MYVYFQIKVLESIRTFLFNVRIDDTLIIAFGYLRK